MKFGKKRLSKSDNGQPDGQAENNRAQPSPKKLKKKCQNWTPSDETSGSAHGMQTVFFNLNKRQSQLQQTTNFATSFPIRNDIS